MIRITPIHLWNKTVPCDSCSISEGPSKTEYYTKKKKKKSPINGSQPTNLELFTEIFFYLQCTYGLVVDWKREFNLSVIHLALVPQVAIVVCVMSVMLLVRYK